MNQQTSNNSTFINIVKNALNSELAYNLSIEEINYINYLILKNNNIANEINTFINTIIHNSKFDSPDIPKIILLFTQLIQEDIINNEVNQIEIKNIVQFLVYGLFLSNCLPLLDNELKIAKKLVDVSLSLLNYNVINSKKKEQKGNCCNFLFNF
jgi:hypothetical protein